MVGLSHGTKSNTQNTKDGTTQNSEEANKREDEKRVIPETEDAQQDKFGAV